MPDAPRKVEDLIPPAVGRADTMELMWRCGQCGEMGHRKDGVPEKCPSCGASRGEIEFVTED
jgi:rubrerythrin